MILLILIINYFLIQFIGACIHWFLHEPSLEKPFSSHIKHHFYIYPIEEFKSVKYKRQLLKDSPVWGYLYPALTFILICFLIFPLYIAVASTMELLLIAAFNAWIHSAIHTKNHWLENYNFFIQWRNLHREHHIDPQLNLGLTFFLADKLFKSYEDPHSH